MLSHGHGANRRHAVPLDLGPSQTFIGRLIYRRRRPSSAPSAASAAASTGSRIGKAMCHGGVDDPRIIEGPDDAGGACLVVLVKDLGPRAPAVGAAVNAALIAPGAQISQRGRQHQVGIVRIHQDGTDAVVLLESDMLPRLSGVGAFVHAQAAVSRAHVNHLRIGRSHLQRSHAGNLRH